MTALRQPLTRRDNLAQASDADLVRAVQNGDMDAAADLWRRHSSSVRQVVRRQLGHDAAVDDLVQEAFLVFLEAPHRVRHSGMIVWFLNGVALHLSLYKIRQRQRVRRLLTDFAELQSNFIAAPPDVDAGRVFQALNRVLKRMPARQGRAFVLRHVRGLELPDIARELDSSLSTIKRDLTRAQRSIQRCAGEPALSQYLSESGCKRFRGAE